MFFGRGILKGMWITLKMFFASYFKKADQGGLFTVEYPEKRLPKIERFRNFPFLVYDETPENIRCVSCDICAKECPPKCIYIERDQDKDGKPLKRPAVFDIDFTVCMNCGICEEACPFDAIFMDHTFEIAAPERQAGLLFGRDQLLRPNEHFQNIRPRDAKSADERVAAAKAKEKAAAEAAALRAKTATPPPAPPASPAS